MAHFNTYMDRADYTLLKTFCIERGTESVLHKNDYFQRVGSRNVSLAYILKGGVRYVCPDGHGGEHVVGYGFEGDYAVDYSAFLRRGAGIVDVQAVEETTLCVIDAGRFDEFAERDGHTRRVVRRMGEELFVTIYDRLLDMYRYTPEERYIRISENYPALVNRVTLRELASFIGVTPEALSRIRRRVAGR